MLINVSSHYSMFLLRPQITSTAVVPPKVNLFVREVQCSNLNVQTRMPKLECRNSNVASWFSCWKVLNGAKQLSQYETWIVLSEWQIVEETANLKLKTWMLNFKHGNDRMRFLKVAWWTTKIMNKLKYHKRNLHVESKTCMSKAKRAWRKQNMNFGGDITPY